MGILKLKSHFRLGVVILQLALLGATHTIGIMEMDWLDTARKSSENRDEDKSASSPEVEQPEFLPDVVDYMVKRNPASVSWLLSAALTLCEQHPGKCVPGVETPDGMVKIMSVKRNSIQPLLDNFIRSKDRRDKLFTRFV